VIVVHRRDSLRASRIMQERAQRNPKISFLWDTVLTGYLGGEVLEAVRIRNLKSNEESVHPIGGVFMGIGHQPNTGFLQGAIDRWRASDFQLALESAGPAGCRKE
jgi:thioredoxin reductase (NADPH)